MKFFVLLPVVAGFTASGFVFAGPSGPDESCHN